MIRAQNRDKEGEMEYQCAYFGSDNVDYWSDFASRTNSRS
jgi:hypothetical protein